VVEAKELERSTSRDQAVRHYMCACKLLVLKGVVGANGFEPSTSWSRDRRSKNLKPCGCCIYKPYQPKNPASVGPRLVHDSAGRQQLTGLWGSNTTPELQRAALAAARASSACRYSRNPASIGPQLVSRRLLSWTRVVCAQTAEESFSNEDCLAGPVGRPPVTLEVAGSSSRSLPSILPSPARRSSGVW
jgi:hypothetical protein